MDWQLDDDRRRVAPMMTHSVDEARRKTVHCHEDPYPTTATARKLISESFRGFVVETSHVAPVSVREERDGEQDMLESQLVAWLGVRPDPAPTSAVSRCGDDG